MEKSSKRGKIPPQDWPSIINRYQSGETLASIARTYDCSPPAISYIVSRTRARNAAAELQSATPSQEPQLVKNHLTAPVEETASAALDSPASPAASATPAPAVAEVQGEPAVAAKPAELRLFPDEMRDPPAPPRDPIPDHRDSATERPLQRPRDSDPSGHGNIARSFAPAAGPPPPLEPRRTLHLSLPGSDAGPRHDPQPRIPQGPFTPGAAPPPNSAPSQADRHAGPYAPAGNGVGPRPVPELPPKEGGAFIDQALRTRVDGDIAAFLAAFDAALDHDTTESRTELREATDRLLRAGARTRIELERLEARVPLVPREKTGHDARAFRPR